jgi:oligoribonuclease NrnB/cAMP/cGMP phosphodiesterase (DHH superfamily)
LYHNDADGLCAAYVAKHFFEEKGYVDNVEYIPMAYGDSAPDIIGNETHVFVLDFSFPKKICDKINKIAASFLILDHHITAKEAIGEADYFEFSFIDSGATMAYNHFCKHGMKEDRALEILCRYVRDRDLWRFELPMSHEINAAIETFPLDFESWDILKCMVELSFADDDKIKSLAGQMGEQNEEFAKRFDVEGRVLVLVDKALVLIGESVLRYKAQIIDNTCENAISIDINGHLVRFVNSCSYHNRSDIGNRLADGAAMSIVWFQESDGKYVYSLRSKLEEDGNDDALDVSQVAKSQGGGGHPKAAGFRCSKPPEFNDSFWRDLKLGFLS